MTFFGRPMTDSSLVYFLLSTSPRLPLIPISLRSILRISSVNADTHLIDQSTIDVSVSDAQRVLDGVLDLSRLGLPCAETDSGDGGARVEGKVGWKFGADGHYGVGFFGLVR
jgi:hypothetical protein